MLYALGFVGLFMFGGLSGLFLAALALDVHLTDTYFVVAHFHYIMVGGSVSAYLGGIHFWWPKITGRMYPPKWAQFAAVLLFLGFNFTFFPQYLLGVEGMPRRYYEYAPEFQTLHVLSSAGAMHAIPACGCCSPPRRCSSACSSSVISWRGCAFRRPSRQPAAIPTSHSERSTRRCC